MVQDVNDFNYAKSKISLFSNSTEIFIQTTKPNIEIANKVMMLEGNVRYGFQLHKLLWGADTKK